LFSIVAIMGARSAGIFVVQGLLTECASTFGTDIALAVHRNCFSRKYFNFYKSEVRTMCREQHIGTLLKHLIERRKQLSDILSGELSNLHNSDDAIGGDVIDLALETDYATVNAKLAEAESRELDDVNEALDRMEISSYGICEDCAKPIPIARLEMNGV